MIATTSWTDANQQDLTRELARVRGILERATSRADRQDDANAGAGVHARPADADSVHVADRSFATGQLSAVFELSPFERDIVLLCAGCELEASFRPLVARLTGRDDPTFGLALAVLPDPHWSALVPDAPLRRWHLVEIGDAELTRAPLRIDERILHWLAGLDVRDDRIARLARDLESSSMLSDGDDSVAARVAELIEQRAMVHLTGADADRRRHVAARACAAVDARAICLRSGDLPSSAADRVLLARLLLREALIDGALLVVDVQGPDDGRAAAFVDAAAAPAIVLSSEPLVFSRELASVEIAPTIWDASRAAARPRLDGLATRIEAVADWDDLILPDAQVRTLRQIATHVRQRRRVYEEWGFAAKSQRGLGITALFSGAPGTGKTMAAEVLARELRLDLYRIDLAGVVSKYIGETEKNLKRVFDAAEGSGAVLLFDEADALFGKRSEVKDSHDRYANIEVSYLLQRMESYRGLAILTSNMKQALDPAFLRRIRFVVPFPFPDVANRAAIWRRVFPAQTPVAALDYERLSQLALPGGNIRNIAIGAAFTAADGNEPVSMRHLAEAARDEYAKLERPLTDAETRGWM